MPDAPEPRLARRLLGDGVLPDDRSVGQLDFQAVREEPAPVLQVEVRVDVPPVPAGARHVGLVDLVAFVASIDCYRVFFLLLKQPTTCACISNSTKFTIVGYKADTILRDSGSCLSSKLLKKMRLL